MTAGPGSSGGAIAYKAPPRVREVIESIGRTEDIRFSPDGRRLAIAAFERNRLALFDVAIAASTSGKDVALERVVEISSPSLKLPHGLDFIDDATLIVVNREGGACVFELPRADAEVQECEVSPVQTMDAGDLHGLDSPGSVWIAGEGRPGKEILICSNVGNRVTRHVVDGGARHTLAGGDVLLRKWLDIPDGVSVSQDRQWLAISNHNTHNVLVYEYSASLGRDADPDGILRGVHYPHGLRFSSDDRHMFVADAGAPYIHVYARDDLGWGGVRNPVASVCVMDDALFERGRHNPEEGGPKGIDIDSSMNVVVVTSECQPLAFFDLSGILEDAIIGSHLAGSDVRVADGPPRSDRGLDRQRLRAYRREQQALQVRCELQAMERLMQARAEAIKARAERSAMQKSRSWRMTAPLRWARSVLP